MKKFLGLLVLFFVFISACQPAPQPSATTIPQTASSVLPTSTATVAPSPINSPKSTATANPAASCTITTVTAAPASTTVAEAPLIPRRTLFTLVDKTGVSLSRDGTKIAYRAPTGGALNIWVAPADNIAAAQPVSNFRRGIRSYSWAWTHKHLIFAEDENGDENFQVYVVDLNNRQTRTLTSLKGVRVNIQRLSDKFPNEILITLNDRDPKQFDLYRLNIETGERKLVLQSENFASFITDDDFNVRFVLRYTSDGGKEYLKRIDKGVWETYLKIGPEDEDTSGTAGFDQGGKILYFIDSRGRNTGAFTSITLDTGAQSLIADNPCSDVNDWITNPATREIQAVAFYSERKRWQVLDKSLAEDFAYLQTVADGDLQILSRSPDLKRWVVSYVVDNGPLRFYLYDRDAKKATFLFSNQKALEDLTFAKMYPVAIKSRDGLNLVSYLTLPVGSNPGRGARPTRPLPLVLDVHGGPWARDEWGFNREAQWLANRGYAVLSVNYRGSEGFGKAFLNAGNKEWGGKMHEDLIDALNWAAQERIADPNKVCIMGGSYGGYATLVGLTFTPDAFACGVDFAGRSDLTSIVNDPVPIRVSSLDFWKTRVGDPSTTEGNQFLLSRSPITFVDRIKKPLLVVQGANDPRVKQIEADQIVQAMQARKIPVTYLLYPDEGHGFSSASNSRSFNAVTEAFLARVLGGRVEPFGNDLSGSSMTVPVGAELIPGLADILKRK